MAKAKRDLCLGIGFAIFGIFMLVSIEDQPSIMASDELGSSWYPRAVLAAMVIVAASLVVGNLLILCRRSTRRSTARESAWRVMWLYLTGLIRTAGTIGIRPLITVWGTIAILVSYVVMIELFGFVVSTLIFLVSYQVFLAKCLVKPIKVMKILAIGVFSTLVIYLVFTQVLGLWLPEGSLVLGLI